MQEIEAKFYVEDLRRIEARLIAMKARLIQPRTHETNIRFDTPTRDLRREGRVLRLRKDDRVHMTYKGGSKRIDGTLSRTEIEFTLDDFDGARLLLESLGYEKLLFYEKYRTTYDLENVLIMVDETPLGDFVEIEGPGVDPIREAAGNLGLDWAEAVAASYSALFDRVCRAQNLKLHDMSFENFNGRKVFSHDLQVRPADRGK